MLKVGLTGGIGSGKTIVSNQFQEMGVPVIDTDVIARELVTSGSEALDAIVEAFGADVLTPGGDLDRKRLGNIVFSDPNEKARLEAILHPEIRRETLLRIEELDGPYCIVVVPLLIETEFVKLVDKVMVVDAPDHRRLEWVKHRNGLTESDIHNIFNAQSSREDRLAAADYVISNDGTVEELQSKVTDLHVHILTECGAVAKL